MAESTTTVIIASRFTDPAPARTPPDDRCRFAGEDETDQQCCLGEDQRTDQDVGKAAMEVKEPVADAPGDTRRRHVRHKLDVIRSTGGSRQRRDREARGGRT